MICIQKAASSLSQIGCEDKYSGNTSVVYCELNYSIVYMLHAICVYSISLGCSQRECTTSLLAITPV